MSTSTSALPALPPTADIRSITERVNVLIRDYNNQTVPVTGMKVTAFSASGTFAPDANCIGGYAVGKGGGGAGGGWSLPDSGRNNGSGGGAEGNTVTKFFVRSDVTPSVSVTIGAGGTGSTSTGGTGGDTSFGSLLTAKGGGGGGTLGNGGSCTTGGNVGDIVQYGAPGESVPNVDSAYAVASAGGSGGGSGGAAGGTTTGGAFNGTAATANSGGGGSGGYTRFNGSSYNGGNGGSGYLYVVQFLGAP